MNENLSTLGGHLRAIRKKQGMTLQQLGTLAGLSAGLISKIENLRATPSLPVLARIAKALNTPLPELFLKNGETADGRKWRHYPAGTFGKIERENSFGIEYRLVFESRLTGDRQQVMLVTVAPGAKSKPVSGDGHEILYMISGSLRYRIGNECIDFQEGDILFFDSSVPHVPENISGKTAVLLAHYHLNEPLF